MKSKTLRPKSHPIGLEDPMLSSLLMGYKSRIISPKRYNKCPFGEVGDRLWIRESWQALRWEYDWETGFCDGYHPCDPNDYKNQVEYNRLCNVIRPDCSIVYKSSWDDYGDATPKGRGFLWRHSVTMPYWASRIILEVVDISSKEISSINEKDVLEDGFCFICPNNETKCYAVGRAPNLNDYTDWYIAFKKYWNSAYDEQWKEDLCVWVCRFKIFEIRGDEELYKSMIAKNESKNHQWDYHK